MFGTNNLFPWWFRQSTAAPLALAPPVTRHYFEPSAQFFQSVSLRWTQVVMKQIWNVILTFLTASWTVSLVRHQSQDPVFSSPFVIRTSETVMFSSPLWGTSDEEDVNPILENTFIPLGIVPVALFLHRSIVPIPVITWQDCTARASPRI